MPNIVDEPGGSGIRFNAENRMSKAPKLRSDKATENVVEGNSGRVCVPKLNKEWWIAALFRQNIPRPVGYPWDNFMRA